MKKVGYMGAVLLVLFTGYWLYSWFFATRQATTPHHTTLTLTPFTQSEKRDLIHTQSTNTKQSATAPLIATTNPDVAQAEVLSIKPSVTQ